MYNKTRNSSTGRNIKLTTLKSFSVYRSYKVCDIGSIIGEDSFTHRIMCSRNALDHNKKIYLKKQNYTAEDDFSSLAKSSRYHFHECQYMAQNE
jgi:hypothetical protein